MLNIEVVFKFKEKEIKSINSKENDNIYEIFNKNIDLKELKLKEYQLYYEEKLINEKTVIKDLANQNKKLVLIIKPIINSVNIRYKLKNQESKIALFGKDFVNKNKIISKFIYEGENYELTQYFEIPNYESLTKNGIGEISITLTNINN